MFTGIIETVGTVVAVRQQEANLHCTIQSSFSKELKPDQSVSHNGVCLTVTQVIENTHTVVAIHETLNRTTLGTLTRGSHVNLERAMSANGRFDGHFVQGHVDRCVQCIHIEDEKGSSKFWFSITQADSLLLVEKGSICVDGVSLTIADAEENKFSVAIIPYTLAHTCFRDLKTGDKVNLEFDVLGKYVQKHLQARLPR